jgi:hypothetical protein
MTAGGGSDGRPAARRRQTNLQHFPRGEYNATGLTAGGGATGPTGRGRTDTR